MAYDETLAHRIRATLAPLADHDEIKMFGGLCFTVGGHMCCGVMKDEMMLRVGPEAYASVLAKPHARVMDFTGRPMRNMVIVGKNGLATDRALAAWLADAVGYASSLPPKDKKRKGKKTGRAKKAPTPPTATSTPGTFGGFGAPTLRFLEGLRHNNDKAWFDAHRADYEAHYLRPALTFIEALGPRLAKLSPSIHYQARVNGSLFRINRDVRFSKDKRPYKDHLDFWFWEGADKSWSTPGFFMRLTPDRLIAGAGLHRFDKPQAAAFREAVVGRAGARLEAAMTSLRAEGFSTAAPTRKRVPKGYDPAHPRADLLLHDGLTVTWEGKLPKEVRSAKLLDWSEARFRALLPVEQWLLKHVVR